MLATTPHLAAGTPRQFGTVRHFERRSSGQCRAGYWDTLNAPNADSYGRAGSEIVVLRSAREPATGVASPAGRGGTPWPILIAEARSWMRTRTLR